MNYFYINPKISYGYNALDSLENCNFESVCIATDKFMVKSKMIKKITDILDSKNIKYHIFDTITSDPSIDIVKEGLSHIINLKPNALIAFGGGSVIDATKAIMYFCIQLKKNFVDKNQIIKPYFIAIPTTAGTGSEVTSFSVISDNKNNIKIPITDDLMLPDEAILDPIVTKSVPKGVTAATGMDVLTHGIESYISIGSNPFSDMYAIKSINLLSNNLIPCYNNLDNLDFRSNLQIASCMAGIAFNSSGLGICHSIAHAIGSNFHLPHGLANAIVLPYIIEFNGNDKDVCSKYIDILNCMGINGVEIGESSSILKLVIDEFNINLNIPSNLRKLNIDKDYFDSLIVKMSESAYTDVCTSTNPVEVTRDSLESIIRKLY